MKKHTLNVSNLSHPSTIEKILDAMDLAFRKSLGWDLIGVSAVENKDGRPIFFVSYSSKRGFVHYTASKRECGQAGGIEITDLINQILFEAQTKLS